MTDHWIALNMLFFFLVSSHHNNKLRERMRGEGGGGGGSCKSEQTKLSGTRSRTLLMILYANINESC